MNYDAPGLDDERDPMWPAQCRRRLLLSRPVNHYPSHTTLSERQLRALMTLESAEALRMARAAGVQTP